MLGGYLERREEIYSTMYDLQYIYIYKPINIAKILQIQHTRVGSLPLANKDNSQSGHPEIRIPL